MLTVVTLEEIEQIFDVIEEFGLSREAVVIPLRPASPGRVRVLPDNRLEIVVESGAPLAEWLPVLRAEIQGIMRSGAGDRLRREDG